MAADSTGDRGIGTGSVSGDGRPNRVAGGSGGTRYHSVTPAGLKQSPIEKVSLPENWSFDTMLTWTRTQAMKRMTDKSITDSARKKACMVQTDRWRL